MGLKALVALFNAGQIDQLPANLWYCLRNLKPGETRHLTWAQERRQVWRDRTGVVRVA